MDLRSALSHQRCQRIEVLRHRPEVLDHVDREDQIERAVSIKAEIVCRDEKDSRIDVDGLAHDARYGRGGVKARSNRLDRDKIDAMGL
jgi:hypothetical protein